MGKRKHHKTRAHLQMKEILVKFEECPDGKIVKHSDTISDIIPSCFDGTCWFTRLHLQTQHPEETACLLFQPCGYVVQDT